MFNGSRVVVTSTKNIYERCHVSNVNVLFIYSLNPLMVETYVCYGKNVKMISPKKRLRAILKIRPHIKVFVHLFHMSKSYNLLHSLISQGQHVVH